MAGPKTPPAGPQTPPADPQTPPAGPQTPLASPLTHPAGPQTPSIAQPLQQAYRWMDRWMGGWTDGWIDRWNFSPFHKTLSPLGAAALLPHETEQTDRKEVQPGNRWPNDAFGQLVNQYQPIPTNFAKLSRDANFANFGLILMMFSM